MNIVLWVLLLGGAVVLVVAADLVFHRWDVSDR